MGHLVNSNLFRLGVSKSWNYKGLFYKNYFNEIFFVKFLFSFLEGFFNNSIFLDRGLIFSHFLLQRRLSGGNDLCVYLFSGYFNNILINFFKKNRLSSEDVAKNQLFFYKYVRFSQNFLFSIVSKRLLLDLYRFGVVDVRFFFLYEYSLSASLLGRLIAFKLKSLYTLAEVVNPIVKDYLHNRKNGLAIVCSGRFTRKQRAHFLRFRAGCIPYGKVIRKVDYFFVSVALKYGACGIKVWLSE